MEVWIATAAVGVYSARKASKASKAQSEFEAKTDKEAMAIQGFEQRRSMQFESDLNERNLQKERDRKARTFAGLARQQGLVPASYQFQQVQVPDAPSNPIPNDAIYTNTAGLSQQPTNSSEMPLMPVSQPAPQQLPARY